MQRLPLVLLSLFLLIATALGIAPHHRSDWALENVLTLVVVLLLVFTHKRMRFSNISYVLIFLFLVLHEVGSHYTYSEVPYDAWFEQLTGTTLSELCGFERNHFDRLVHFAYGFLLAFPFRELFVRVAEARGFWGYFLPLDVIMSTSMLYELIEWGAAMVVGDGLGQAYLGTQGDVWDAHKDMLLATLGALIALVIIGLVHRTLARDFNREWRESLRVKAAGPLAIALLLTLTAGCASTEYQRRDWTEYSGPGAEWFLEEEVEFPHFDDPLEPLNRVTSKVNYELLRWVIAPAATVYRFFIPEVVRTRVAKAGDNLQFPGRFVNNALQGKLRETGVETARFAINSTVGLLGLFDPAQTWGLHPYPEDFGQTFATWGWKPSTYLVLPFLGPSTVRDGFGEIPDALADPATYHSPAVQVRGFNSLSNHVDADLRTIESAYDAYEAGRTLYMLQREVDVTDFEWEANESSPTQTLSAIFLEPEDPEFAADAETRTVHIDAARPALPYSLWLQPEPAPVFYILPGFGGNRLGNSALALAEIAFERGHTVVALSSPTNWEFMRFGASVTVPGYGPVDAHDVHVALTAIDGALAKRYPGHLLERRLGGLSIGAYQTLMIAANADRGQQHSDPAGLLEFDLFLALNPPVSLEHALLQLDRFYNAPLAFPAAERAQRIEEIFGKVLYLSHGDLEPGMQLPFTELESRFLIGMAFRLDLQFLILQSQELHDSGVLLTKRSRLHMAPAFREAAEYSYMEYFYAFVLPYFAERDDAVSFDAEGARVMFERSNLRSLGAQLQANERVRVFTNENDFLLRPQDVEWLRARFGERLTLSPEGGHLGNLYREYMQDMIGDFMEGGVE